MSRTLDHARLDLPHLVTALPGPRAAAVMERDARVVSPSYTRGYPLVVERGEGSMVEDVDGNRFLDFNAGIAVCATGHCHPRVVEAIQKQAARLIHMSGTDFYYEEMVALAEKLAALAPGDVDRRVSFCNSGAEAVEGAIKLARWATGRSKIIAFFGSFHGRTMGALSLTSRKAVQRAGFGPLIPDIVHTPYPYCYRCPFGKQTDTCAVECVKFIEDTILKTIAPAAEVAAIAVEAVQGEGGYVVPPQKFMTELARVAKQNGILLIFDEVQSGMGRTGKMWAAEHFDAVPGHLRRGQRDRQRTAAGRHGGARRPDDVAAGRACLHVRGQPGGLPGGPGDHRAAGRGAGGECRAHGKLHDGAVARLAGPLPGGGRCARAGLDDRGGAGAQSADARGCGGAARPGDVAGVRARIAGVGRGRFHATAVPAAGDYARAVRLRDCDTGRMPDEGHGRRMKTLDVGCGIRKQPGSIGLDRNPASRADVLADLDRFPYPFADSSFDRVTAIHVIEHLSDVIRAMEEFHRLVRAGGTVRIETPHYTDFSSFCDPTHKSHLTSFSFRYFGENHGGFGYYSNVKFREISVHVRLLAVWRWLGFEFLVNRFPRYRRFGNITCVTWCAAR
jgi:SAM-dependent methyltransferase